MSSISLVLVLICAAAVDALDAKWTPNGEAPAPYSTNARQQMGMDPSAMAGQATGAPVVPPGGGVMMRFNMGALLVLYLSNNWKVVEAIQALILKLLQPILVAMGDRKAQQAKEALAASAAAARKARIARLKAQGSSAKQSAAADDDEEDEEDED